MNLLQAVFGPHSQLITGIQDDEDEGVPVLRVYVGPRYRGHYVLVSGPDIENVRRGWEGSSMEKLFLPVPPGSPVYQDDAVLSPNPSEETE